MIGFESKSVINSNGLHRATDHPLHPMLTSLSVLGIGIFYPFGSIKRGLIRVQIAIVMLWYHYWALSDVVWYFRNNVQPEMLADSVTVWASVCTVDFLFLKRQKFRKVLAIIHEETVKISNTDQDKYRKLVKIVCFLTWIYISMFVIQYLCFGTRSDYEKYFSNTPLYYFYRYFSEKTIIMIIKIDECVQCFFIQGSFTMIITLYVLLCVNVHLWFKTLRESLTANRKTSLTLGDVQSFRNAFEHLSRNVDLLDEVFSRTVALWLLVILLTLCVRIIAILNPLYPTTIQMIVITALALTRATATLICVSLSADKVHKGALLCLGQLDRLLRKSKSASNSVYHEVQLAFTKHAFFPIQLTVWKFAGLNRAFMMTCVGMMTTYVIICIQLNPNAMKGLTG